MLYVLMGKSSSGKDTVYKRLTGNAGIAIDKIVTYTTRPMRENEVQDREYHFVDEKEMEKLEKSGKVVERRSYNTVYGQWNYFTVDDGSFDVANRDYIIIGTLESFEKIVAYFGNDKVKPLYLQIDDGARLERALERERQEKSPKYAEMCRRYLADEKDFCEENLTKLGIDIRFDNDDIEECVDEIKKYINCTNNIKSTVSLTMDL